MEKILLNLNVTIACICTCMHARTHTCMCTHTHTHTHLCTHARTHTHTSRVKLQSIRADVSDKHKRDNEYELLEEHGGYLGNDPEREGERERGKGEERN